jgi:hypothetical protein
MADIKFVGGVKQIFPELFNLSFKLDQLPLPNARGYINLRISKSKVKGNWYCCVNDYKPKHQEEQPQERNHYPESQDNPPIEEENLPF